MLPTTATDLQHENLFHYRRQSQVQFVWQAKRAWHYNFRFYLFWPNITYQHNVSTSATFLFLCQCNLVSVMVFHELLFLLPARCYLKILCFLWHVFSLHLTALAMTSLAYPAWRTVFLLDVFYLGCWLEQLTVLPLSFCCQTVQPVAKG